MAGTRNVIDRGLPERSWLRFYFPRSGNDTYVVRMPFFENIKLKETKRARYQKYNPISRSSNLYAYTGADSRKFSLAFYMTAQHIMDEYSYVNSDKFILEAQSDFGAITRESFKDQGDVVVATSENYYDQFFRSSTEIKASANQVFYNSDWSRNGGITQLEKDQLFSFYDLKGATGTQAIQQSLANTGGFIGAALANQFDDQTSAASRLSEVDRLRLRVIDVIVYWVNIIRASLTNNAKNPLYGPPVIRLHHGILYQDVPCVCTDYSISWDERAGYDLKTMLPRRLQITMSLEEFRTGDFGEFEPNNIIKRDNLAGWEATFAGGASTSLDPGFTSIF